MYLEFCLVIIVSIGICLFERFERFICIFDRNLKDLFGCLIKV